MIHIFFVRMYHQIIQFMIPATYEYELNLGIHLVTVLITANKSTNGNMKKMCFSKHFTFNPSMFGLRDNNSSPSGTLLASSRFVLATCINFMGFVLLICLLGVVWFFCRGWDLIYKLCQVTNLCVLQSEFKDEEKKVLPWHACIPLSTNTQ